MATTYGRLDELSLDRHVAGSPDAPGTIIVGDVVSRRAGDAGQSPAELLSGAIPIGHQW